MRFVAISAVERKGRRNFQEKQRRHTRLSRIESLSNFGGFLFLCFVDLRCKVQDIKQTNETSVGRFAAMGDPHGFIPDEIPRGRLIEQNYTRGDTVIRLPDRFNEYETLLDQGMSLDGFDLKKMFEEYDPQQLIQVISQHGVMLLGEMELEDWLVRREFEGRTTLTVGRDDMHLIDWKKQWMDHLVGGGKRLEGNFESRLVKVEAFVVTIRNAAGVREKGLLYNLIRRSEADKCPIKVWGLTTVRALVSYKWNHWARRYVAIQFFIYCIWVVAFVSLALSFKANSFQIDPSQTCF